MSTSLLPVSSQFVKTPVSVLHDRRLSDRALRLLLLIREDSWRDGTADRGRAYYAGELDCSLPTVDRAFSELEAAGYVTVAQSGPHNAVVTVVGEEKPAPRPRSSPVRTEPPAHVELDASDATASDVSPAPLPPTPDPAGDSAAAALTEKGMDPYLARKAVALYGVDRCQKALHRLSRERDVRQPGRWLWCALSRGYDLETPAPSPSPPSRKSRPPLTGYTVTDDKGRPVFVVTEPRRGPRSAPSSPSGG